MSAFLCTPEHIQTIVAWAAANNVLPPDLNSTELAHELATANLRSVEYRYPDTAGNSAAFFLGFTPNQEYPDACVKLVKIQPRTPVEIIKLIDCLIYQSCETPDWETSRTKQYLQLIQRAAIQHLPGYCHAPWDI